MPRPGDAVPASYTDEYWRAQPLGPPTFVPDDRKTQWNNPPDAIRGLRADDQGEMIRQRFTGIEELRSLDWMAQHAAVIPAAGGGAGSLLDELRAQMQAQQGPQTHQPPARRSVPQQPTFDPPTANTFRSGQAPAMVLHPDAVIGNKPINGLSPGEIYSQMRELLSDQSQGMTGDDVVADFLQAVDEGQISRRRARELIDVYNQMNRDNPIALPRGEARGVSTPREPPDRGYADAARAFETLQSFDKVLEEIKQFGRTDAPLDDMVPSLIYLTNAGYVDPQKALDIIERLNAADPANRVDPAMIRQ